MARPRLVLLLATTTCATAVLGWPAAGPAQPRPEARWRPFVQAVGAIDVVGPRRDGRLLVATTRSLFLLRTETRSLRPFAPEYTAPGGESYVALAPDRRLRSARCSFRRDDVFALDHGPVLGAAGPDPGIDLISRRGGVRRFAEFAPGAFPSGIAFDRAEGRFGGRLLVTVVAGGVTTLHAFDCRGRSRIVTATGPRVEGGMAVAPRSFGRFAGRLIAADEHSGRIFAFGARGRTQLLAESGLPAGADIGVESVGFAPRRFDGRVDAYQADLGAPGSPTEGTDSVLRVRGFALARAGVRPGDMVVSTEAGARTIRVRCGRRCRVRSVGRGPDEAHGEGHITFLRRR